LALKSKAHTFGSIKVRTPPVAPGLRIGILGGSFNPPHEGHLIIAATALKRLRLDQIWWVVTPGNPLKPHDGQPPQAERMALCRALARGPRMKVTGFEDELGSPYTALTAGFLAARYPNTRFVWIMGADNLASFHRWQDWRGIAALMPIAIADRPGWRLKALASKASHALMRRRQPEPKAPRIAGFKSPVWVFLTSRLNSTSSTTLRSEREKNK
jgi:nicotinate-nucleotide adenylyltransferase